MKRWLGWGLLTVYLWGASLGSSVAQGLAPVYSSLAYQLGAVSVVAGKDDPSDHPKLPHLRLGTDDGLRISFDLLDQPQTHLSYRISQLDRQGEPTRRPAITYLSSFADGRLDPPIPSRGVLRSYDHYTLELPNLAKQLKESGSYQLEIYTPDEPEASVLLIPFFVSEEVGLGVVSALATSLLGSDALTSQQVDIRLLLSASLGIRSQDLHPVVVQNARLDNAVILTSPSYASLTEVRYEADRGARFEGGNTYLKLEHLTDEAQGLGVEACLQTDSGTLLRLLPLRQPGALLFRPDPAHQGIQRLRSLDTEDVATEGEYHAVDFRLMMPWTDEGEVFLAGEAFRYLPEVKRLLKYDSSIGGYRTTLPLKSGYQEYQYLLRPHGRTSLISAPTVGSHYQTTNYYTVLVYLRGARDMHDRLIAYQTL